MPSQDFINFENENTAALASYDHESREEIYIIFCENKCNDVDEAIFIFDNAVS